MDTSAKIYVAGHRGMVGTALVRRLQAAGYSRLLTPSRHELDLLDQAAVFGYLADERPDYMFIAAAKVGGIHANNTFPADFLYQNLTIESNLIEGAHRADMQRLMFLGSSCIYPRDCPQPIKEEYLLTGPLEPTNEPYAIAKIAGIKLCEGYNRQHGRQYVSVMPTNLYGPNDNYNLLGSHVLPAIIRKCHLARLAQARRLADIAAEEDAWGPIPDDVLLQLGIRRALDELIPIAEPKVQIWGTGRPMREFLYVDDLADACVYLMMQGYDGPLLNIGTGSDVTIAQIAETVKAVVGFDGELAFDDSKPDGTPRKLLNVDALTRQGWLAQTTLENGIRLAYADYLSRCPRSHHM